MYRRDHQRFEVNTLAILVISKNHEKTFLLKNISARGAAVVGNHPLKINNKLTIIIQIPFLYEKPICKVARIVWCKKVNERLWEGGLDFGLDNKIDLVSQ